MKITFTILLITLINLTLFAQWDEFNWDTIKFESPYQYIEIGSDPNNIWEVGVPSKTFFNSAFSPIKAIVTDVNNYYSVNNHSFFDLYVGAYNSDWFPYEMFFEIQHKFDTDTLKDGGYITVSYDMGQTWVNIINDSPSANTYEVPNANNIYVENLYQNTDTLFNGEYGFSGKSEDWVTTRFSWWSPGVKSLNSAGDTMIMRFNFISDNIETNKEGWMIDDIRLYSKNVGGKINNKETAKSVIILPNPTNDFFVIKGIIPQNEDCEIYNLQGELVKRVIISNSESKVSVKDLGSGIYIVKVGQQTKKLVVE